MAGFEIEEAKLMPDVIAQEEVIDLAVLAHRIEIHGLQSPEPLVVKLLHPFAALLRQLDDVVALQIAAVGCVAVDVAAHFAGCVGELACRPVDALGYRQRAEEGQQEGRDRPGGLSYREFHHPIHWGWRAVPSKRVEVLKSSYLPESEAWRVFVNSAESSSLPSGLKVFAASKA